MSTSILPTNFHAHDYLTARLRLYTCNKCQSQKHTTQLVAATDFYEDRQKVILISVFSSQMLLQYKLSLLSVLVIIVLPGIPQYYDKCICMFMLPSSMGKDNQVDHCNKGYSKDTLNSNSHCNTQISQEKKKKLILFNIRYLIDMRKISRLLKTTCLRTIATLRTLFVKNILTSKIKIKRQIDGKILIFQTPKLMIS